jgi:hypothetical protein
LSSGASIEDIIGNFEQNKEEKQEHKKELADNKKK